MYRLSTNLKFFQYLLIAFIVLFFIGWINAISLNVIGIKKDGLLGLPILILTGCTLLFLIKKLKVVEFDSHNLYIKNKRNNVIIPLEKIIKVKMIMIEIGNANFYKIEFTNSDGKIDSVRILPNDLFSHFLTIVKQKNNNLKVKHWSHSLDLDI